MTSKAELMKPRFPFNAIPEKSEQGDIFSVKKTSSGKGNTQVPTPAAAKAVKTSG